MRPESPRFRVLRAVIIRLHLKHRLSYTASQVFTECTPADRTVLPNISVVQVYLCKMVRRDEIQRLHGHNKYTEAIYGKPPARQHRRISIATRDYEDRKRALLAA
jgi:hypothetical protein